MATASRRRMASRSTQGCSCRQSAPTCSTAAINHAAASPLAPPADATALPLAGTCAVRGFGKVRRPSAIGRSHRASAQPASCSPPLEAAGGQEPGGRGARPEPPGEQRDVQHRRPAACSKRGSTVAGGGDGTKRRASTAASVAATVAVARLMRVQHAINWSTIGP